MTAVNKGQTRQIQTDAWPERIAYETDSYSKYTSTLSNTETWLMQTHFLPKFSHLTDFKAKHFFEVRWLTDEQQIEGPAPAEVGHNDCIDRHGGEELSPGRLVFL